MSVRLYVGNLPQSFDAKELDALFAGVGEGIRFRRYRTEKQAPAAASASPTWTTRRWPMP